MVTALVVIAALVLAALIYLATLPGNYEIRVSRNLPATAEQVFNKIIEFDSWNEWSPWLMHEPDCPLRFSGNSKEVGGKYSWDGKMIGAGSMEHTLLDSPNRAEQKLTFTRPFKSICTVGFELEAIERGESPETTSPQTNSLETTSPNTKVTWYMRGSMPFLFRPMIPRTKEMISEDYSTGLAMLAGVIDPTSEHPRFEFIGEQQRETTTYLAIPWEGSIEDMPEAMRKGFSELHEYVSSGGALAVGVPFSVIHKAKKRATYFVMDMAIPVAEGTEDNKYEVKQIEGGKFHQTQLTGSYDFLKGAWYSAMAHLKMSKTKFDWKRPCVELYENDPHSVEHSNEIVTSIYVPIK